MSVLCHCQEKNSKASFFTGTDTNLHEERLTRAMRLRTVFKICLLKGF